MSLEKDRARYNQLWNTNYGNENDEIVALETYYESIGQLDELVKPMKKKQRVYKPYTIKDNTAPKKNLKWYNHLKDYDLGNVRERSKELDEAETKWCEEHQELFFNK